MAELDDAVPVSKSLADQVARDLDKAEEHYKSFRGEFDRQATALSLATQEVTRLRHEVERQHERAEDFRKALVEIQRATIGGDVYNLILQSCIRLTGARRGMYLSDEGATLLVRANVGIFGSLLSHPPSAFMDALGRRVLDRDDAVVVGDCDTRDLPAPEEGARFANCAAIPVSIGGVKRGVLIVADKLSGEFDESDLETLLHVGDQASIAVDNAQLQREIEAVYRGTVSLLADAVETKDPYTRGHCEQVSQLAYAMATALGLNDTERETICLAALLHDIGKICISDGLLNKPGPLLPEERDVVRAHARIGADLVRALPALATVSEVVLHHHEHFDGNGYPDGLKGEAIPMGARIVAVLDAYSAMIDRRSYKPAFDESTTRAELKRCAGTQFDPRLVDVFLQVLDNGPHTALPVDRPGLGALPLLRRNFAARH